MAVLTAPPPVAPPVLAPAPSPVRQPRTKAAAGVRRDPFVDVVRALGTLGVVALHWTMAQATWDGTTLQVGNALADGAGWLLTWALPLSLLFFAAGASAAYQRTTAAPGAGSGWLRALGGRVRTVARPVGVYVATWAAAVLLLLAAGLPAGAVLTMARTAPQLLWFLGVWLVLVTVAPLLQAAWRRWRWRAAAVALAVPLLADAVRFGLGAAGDGDWLGGIGQLAWINVVAGWAVPFLAGIAYATDRADRERRSNAVARPAGRAGTATAGRARSATARLAAAAVVALAVAALLVAVGPYPRSLVGMPGAAISNLGPPTAPVVLHGIGTVCAVLAARSVLVRWAARPTVSRYVTWLARRSMTVYLWHLTAMFVVVGVVLLGLDERLPAPWSADWWASRPTWFAAYGLVLAGLVRLFGRFEHHRTALRPSTP